MIDALRDGREIFREHAAGERLDKTAAKVGSALPDEAVKQSPQNDPRRQALLEMHAIARETFAANLASESGAGEQFSPLGSKLRGLH